MKLNKEHRAAILDRRDKLMEQLSITNECVNKREKDTSLQHWWAIDVWLIEAQIQLIDKGIINNEIEF